MPEQNKIVIERRAFEPWVKIWLLFWHKHKANYYWYNKPPRLLHVTNQGESKGDAADMADYYCEKYDITGGYRFAE